MSPKEATYDFEVFAFENDENSPLKLMNCLLKMMHSLLKMMIFILKTDESSRRSMKTRAVTVRVSTELACFVASKAMFFVFK